MSKIHINDDLSNQPNEKLEAIRKLFPDCFDADNNLVPQKLQDVLTNQFPDAEKDHFIFNWAGKQKAREIAHAPYSDGTFEFCPEKSKNFDETQNLIIESDNLQALKLLRKSYRGKVKCIYIDPPYNTGNDFVYNDKFELNIKEYIKSVEGNDEAIYDNITKESGKKHSKWLSFMYPRLVLARELLREDGVIFISIDDNEQANLRLLMNEVFGEGEFVNQIIWYYSAMSSKPKNKLRNSAEYILMYAKNKDNIIINEVKEDKMKNRNIIDIIGKLSKNFHFVKEEAMKSLGYEYDDVEQDWYSWYSQTQKDYFQNSLDSVLYVPVVNRMAKEYIKEFNNQKPIALIKKLLQISTSPNDLILDFFAGSGTTGQAVMELNFEETQKAEKEGLLAGDKPAGGRKFILVQLPEKISEKQEAFKAGYRVISDITMERVRRAGGKYKGVDTGFKALKLTQNPDAETLWQLGTLENGNFILTHLALYYGYGLNFKAEKIAEKEIYLLKSEFEGVLPAVVILERELLQMEDIFALIQNYGKQEFKFFARDCCLNIELTYNLLQHFKEESVVVF